LTSVERIEVGDRVLARDVETGELAYKPVLHRTVRPTGPMVRVRLESESIDCSGGHPFWQSGRGWVKARSLAPGSRLHGVDGPSRVVGVEETGEEVTYNLVVADFHTYFAGMSMVLTHDNTIRKPTDIEVPGLPLSDTLDCSQRNVFDKHISNTWPASPPPKRPSSTRGRHRPILDTF